MTIHPSLLRARAALAAWRLGVNPHAFWVAPAPRQNDVGGIVAWRQSYKVKWPLPATPTPPLRAPVTPEEADRRRAEAQPAYAATLRRSFAARRAALVRAGAKVRTEADLDAWLARKAALAGGWQARQAIIGPWVAPGNPGAVAVVPAGWDGYFDRSHWIGALPTPGARYACAAGIKQAVVADQGHVTRWKGGRPRTERSADRRLRVRSVGIIQHDSRIVLWVQGPRSGTTTLPEGYRWMIDASGLAAVAPDGVEYHPNADHVRRADIVVVNIDRTRADRAHAAAQAAKWAAEDATRAERAQGIFVCMADARSVGYCAVGTHRWASDRGLGAVGGRTHVPATVVLRVAGDDPRPRNVVEAAIARASREEETGYCDLAYHGYAPAP